MEKVRLCTLAEIPKDRPLRLTLADGSVVAAIRLRSGVVVTDEKCPHRGAPLSQSGEVEDDVLHCLWHRCRFDLHSGRVIEGPCPAPLKLYPCEVDGDAAYLK